MTGILVLWGHALAALIFAALAVAEWRRSIPVWPRLPIVAALTLTALWALAVAGIGANDVSTRLAETARDLAWLAVMAAMMPRAGGGGRAVMLLYVAVALVVSAAGTAALTGPVAPGDIHDVLRIVALIASLALLHRLVRTTRLRGEAWPIAVVLGTMWSLDLVATATASLGSDRSILLAALRGPAMVAAALLIAAAAQRGVERPALSRAMVWRAMTTIGVLCYAGLTAGIATLADAAFGSDGRLAQTAIVFGATAALLTLASTPWLRAWARVKVAKHLFRHRYDYRVEWQRFTATLGSPGRAVDPLPVRVVRAVADLTHAPAGLLLIADEGVLTTADGWNWPGAPDVTAPALARYLAASGRIVSLDTVRGDACAPEERDLIPAALLADPNAWAIVPLQHGDALAGAIILARPPVEHALDWEDLDLLRVAGRQAASYLAEDRAHAALAETARFGEFNRRFAFLLHDIKNVASQLTLVARNAERHAANPAFRTDMIATLRDAAERMTTLLARLGEHDATRPEPSRPVDLAALARSTAAARRAQHPVEVELRGAAPAIAHATRLEQVLAHLVQNAIEASSPGAPVRLVVRGVGERVAIDVVDVGVGMAPGFVRERLFKPFESTKPAGFGIGAYEARRSVRLMGGEIEVHSRPGEGSRFSILLPAAATLEHAA